MSQEKSKTMPMQNFLGVKEVCYGIVQVENTRNSHACEIFIMHVKSICYACEIFTLFTCMYVCELHKMHVKCFSHM